MPQYFKEPTLTHLPFKNVYELLDAFTGGVAFKYRGKIVTTMYVEGDRLYVTIKGSPEVLEVKNEWVLELANGWLPWYGESVPPDYDWCEYVLRGGYHGIDNVQKLTWDHKNNLSDILVHRPLVKYLEELKRDIGSIKALLEGECPNTST